MWSDGNELTANDYVETFRYSADPKHAWDFAWYWSGVIKNYTEAVAGKAPVNSIGVGVGKNKYTFVVTTEGPVAFIPNAMLYSMPLSAAGLAKYGNGLYNINPATCISCGPYILKTFNPTSEVVLTPNPKYSAPYKPYITHQKSKIYAGADYLPLLDTGVVDYNETQALSQDRPCHSQENPEALQGNAGYQPAGLPGLLRVLQDQGQAVQQLEGAAGLRPLRRPQPDHQRPAPRAGHPRLRLPHGGLPVRNQPAARARHQLRPGEGAEATGRSRVPEGQRFPDGDVQLPRRRRRHRQHHYRAGRPGAFAELEQVLFGGSSTLLLSELDTSTFYTKMEALPTQIEMGFVSYGMDYFDASNMLSVYKAGGRHDWDNAHYDNLFAQGAATFNQAKRQEIYTEAQTLLTYDAPAVFVFHGLDKYLMWPYVQGPALAKNYLGYNGLQWPGFFPFSTYQEGIYIGNNVNHYPRQSESF